MRICGTLERLSAVSVENKTVFAERNPQQALTQMIEELHRQAPDSVGDLLHFRAEACDEQKGDYYLCAQTSEWMQNAFGSLHGGMFAAVMDQAMGYVAMYLMDGTAVTPSIQLNVTYHRPAKAGSELSIKVHVDAVTKSIIYLRSEITERTNPNRLLTSATGIYAIKTLQKNLQ